MTIGAAMIIRNGGNTVEKALGPFLDMVDEIVIVYGGKSTDDTEEVVDRLYDDHAKAIVHYPGPLDDHGRLLNFGDARQYVTDLLTTDWMIVIDADDVWHGVEDHLKHLIDDIDPTEFDIVMVPLRSGGGELIQPRFFRRDSGTWMGFVHEYWKQHEDKHGLKTDLIYIEQENDPSASRPGHNIAIAEYWIEKNMGDQRLLAHLGKDYVQAGEYDAALKIFDQYLKNHDHETPKPDEVFQMFYTRAITFMHLHRLGDALQSATMALMARPYAMAWTICAESALLMGHSGKSLALYQMCIDFADRAIAAGRSRSVIWTSREMEALVPLRLKADALTALGRHYEALAILDLAADLDPTSTSITKQRQVLCTAIGEIAK